MVRKIQIIGKIKILHVLWRGHSGGAERFVRDITFYSNKTKFEHQVLFLSDPGRFGRIIAESGIPVHSLGMRRSFSFINALGFRRLIRSYKPDIIHNHSKDFITNAFICRINSAVKIFFEHGGDLISNNSERAILFYHCFIRYYDLVLANSEYIRQRILALNKVNPQKVRTFYIGIDPTPYQSDRGQGLNKPPIFVDANKKVIGVVGRLVEEKGIDDFIKVADEIQRVYQDVIFLIVGDGKKRVLLQRMAAQHEADIRFLGDRSDVPDILNIFDIFLFTSKRESYGIALLESMAARVPVLGFAVGGANEILKNGGGVLLETRNHKELARLTVEFLMNPTACKRLSTTGYANLMDNFHIRKSIDILEQEYLSLLSPRRDYFC